MKHQISNDRKTLTFILSDAEKKELANEENESESLMLIEDWMEEMFCNCGLESIRPEDTGDLTDAPIYGILGGESTDESGPFGCVDVGFWNGKAQFQPILERWAYMDYQVSDLWEVLLTKGKVTLTS